MGGCLFVCPPIFNVYSYILYPIYYIHMIPNITFVPKNFLENQKLEVKKNKKKTILFYLYYIISHQSSH